MHPDDPWTSMYGDAVTCTYCADTYKNQHAFEAHLNYCADHYKAVRAEHLPKPLVEVVTELQVQEARDDLLALLDELS